MKVLVAQLCPTLCDLKDCSPAGSSVYGILQARILEWVAIPFSRGSSQPRDGSQVSCTAGRFFITWATTLNDMATIHLLTFLKTHFLWVVSYAGHWGTMVDGDWQALVLAIITSVFGYCSNCSLLHCQHCLNFKNRFYLNSPHDSCAIQLPEWSFQKVLQKITFFSSIL